MSASTKNFRYEMYRKLIHLSSLWMPLFIFWVPKVWACLLFATVLVADLITEYANYKRYKWARKTFGRLFFKTLRTGETSHRRFLPSGSVYVLTAAFLCALLFSKEIAALSLSVMLISDSCAALVGKKFGQHKIYKQKSLEGTLAFFISALIINGLFYPLVTFNFTSLFACLAASTAELWEDKFKIDDNLSVPLIIGAILSYM